MLGAAAGLAARGVAMATAGPSETLARLRDTLEGVGEIAWAALNPAPETPLNVEIGPHRRYLVVRQRLDDYKQVKNALGGTVNDVVLTVVSGALARWLRSRGIRTEGLEMRALVPVSVRTQDEHGAGGNRLTVMRGPLPVYIRDPVARLRFVKKAMDGLKESKQAVGAATLAAVTDLSPPTILAQASRLNFSTRLFNLIVTNIPGPQMPLYLLGQELEDLFPIAFLPKDHALAVAIMSYNGRLEYGLLADWDALPDLDVIVDGIDEALNELLEAARGKTATPANGAPGVRSGRSSQPNGGAPVAILPSPRARAKRGPAADMRAKRNRSRSRRNGPKRPSE
jgi:WS/DGAT/MGAT family acyltransferase